MTAGTIYDPKSFNFIEGANPYTTPKTITSENLPNYERGVAHQYDPRQKAIRPPTKLAKQTGEGGTGAAEDIPLSRKDFLGKIMDLATTFGMKNASMELPTYQSSFIGAQRGIDLAPLSRALGTGKRNLIRSGRSSDAALNFLGNMAASANADEQMRQAALESQNVNREENTRVAGELNQEMQKRNEFDNQLKDIRNQANLAKTNEDNRRRAMIGEVAKYGLINKGQTPEDIQQNENNAAIVEQGIQANKAREHQEKVNVLLKENAKKAAEIRTFEINNAHLLDSKNTSAEAMAAKKVYEKLAQEKATIEGDYQSLYNTGPVTDNILDQLNRYYNHLGRTGVTNVDPSKTYGAAVKTFKSGGSMTTADKKDIIDYKAISDLNKTQLNKKIEIERDKIKEANTRIREYLRARMRREEKNVDRTYKFIDNIKIVAKK